ncbi:MAG TPA: helix-turn-helix domain-containing protein, partial [Pseudonocardia sp.]
MSAAPSAMNAVAGQQRWEVHVAVAGNVERVGRILDAAADLMLRWGYKRVTVEEVAKHAGIGKGTVYLHFSTRGSLFMSVLTRESVDLVHELIEAIRADPVAMLPAEQAQANYLAVMRRPLLRAMFSRDLEVLGDLATEAADSPLRAMKLVLAGELFQLWREHGLLRTDLDIATQNYILNATQTGFYLSGSIGGCDPLPDAAAALAHTVRQALHHPGTPDPEVLEALAPK